jgi:DNA gyrase subunit A
VVTLTEKGYIKRLPSNTYRAQRRGGRGITGMVTREDDAVQHLLVPHAHDSLLFFTNRGRVYQLKVYELPDTSRTAKGEHIINLISIEQKERVTAVVAVPKDASQDCMIVATRLGEIKKTAMTEFESVRRPGVIAMNLEDNDELIGAKIAHTDDDILLISDNGQAIRFTVEELRLASRTSGGVRGLRLNDGARLVSVNIAAPGSELLVVTEHGYGKRTPIEEYPKHNRGGSGVMTARLTDKTGKVAAARVVTEQDSDVMLVSASGVVIRMDLSTIRVLSRSTQGTLVQKLAEDDVVVAVSTTNGKREDDPEDEIDTPETGENSEIAENTGEQEPLAETSEDVVETDEDADESDSED